MAGKWSKFIGKYPWLPEDPSREQAMGARLRELEKYSLSALADAFDESEVRKKTLSDELKEVELEIDCVELAMARRCEAEGLDRITTNGRNYTPSSEPYPQVTDKSALIAHGIDGHPELLSYQHQTLKTLIKAAVEGEGTVPPGVDIFMKRTFSRTKAK